MRHRIAKVEDSEILGELNHQLIKDEGHRNSMRVSELVERMRAWLINDYRASVFENDSGIRCHRLLEIRWVHRLQPLVGDLYPGLGTKCEGVDPDR
jgi:hypothetical protein